ncbi:MAG: hypothetical protein HC767_11105 [Akkermansiaceae bacterium]|nr:hypothetical protein [Akkermansiaceae bacterium]
MPFPEKSGKEYDQRGCGFRLNAKAKAGTVILAGTALRAVLSVDSTGPHYRQGPLSERS